MMNIELECGKILTAKKIAEKSAQMVTLFDLWQYSAFVAPLEIAFAEKKPLLQNSSEFQELITEYKHFKDRE